MATTDLSAFAKQCVVVKSEALLVCSALCAPHNDGALWRTPPSVATEAGKSADRVRERGDSAETSSELSRVFSVRGQPTRQDTQNNIFCPLFWRVVGVGLAAGAGSGISGVADVEAPAGLTQAAAVALARLLLLGQLKVGSLLGVVAAAMMCRDTKARSCMRSNPGPCMVGHMCQGVRGGSMAG